MNIGTDSMGFVLGEGLRLGWPFPEWIPDLKQHAELHGWLLEENLHKESLVLSFYKFGEWISVVCETNGDVKVENQNIDSPQRVSQLKTAFI
jgi:hypothetical protein